MALIDDVKQICDRLADSGWQELMLKHGIDIKQQSAQSLADALAIEITIDKDIPGFADFVEDRARGIEPGNPAASLLYHAFASPGVQQVPEDDSPFGNSFGALSQPITAFPTLEELDTIENYIFAQAHRSLAEVREYAATLLGVSESSVELSVAVFAAEYRPAPETPHQRYADLCLSRTGVARVGTASAIYDGKLRGYVPFREGDSLNAIRVLPCRYATWLAARSTAKEDRFGPARVQQSDSNRDFWVPVHKLFEGSECLTGETLNITLESRHQNKKIERLHAHLETVGVPSGFSASDRQQSPFIKEHGLADWVGIFSGGGGLISPQSQPFVERASFNNEHLTFVAPEMGTEHFGSAFAPTLSLNSPPPPVRPWPEYAHVRFDVRDGNAVYIGATADTMQDTTAGGYRALNISDSTGDGWVRASIPQLATLPSVAAYSIIAAPDFFPGVDQREVYEWWQTRQFPEVKSTLPAWWQAIIDDGDWDFWRAAPLPLSDERHAPNIQLSAAGFSEQDDTVTAIVTPLQRIDLRKSKPVAPTTQRHAVLADAAAGIFAPGWDTSTDRIPGSNTENHLSAYGLGSPFPEDAKLCAALSTFWPAVAPDTARTFYQVPFAAGTVCPLTDEENGAAVGSVSWDGLRGPRVLSEDGRRTHIGYPDYEHADYTLNAFEGRFSIAQTQKIDFHEYTHRIVATLRMYRALKTIGDKNSLHILSFRQVESTNALLRQAQTDTVTALTGPIYRFDVFDSEYARTLPAGDVTEENFEVDVMFTLLIGSGDGVLAMARRGDGSQARSPWQVIDA